MLAAMDPNLRELFRPLVNEVIRLSEEADKAATRLIDEHDATALVELNRAALDFVKQLPETVANRLGEESIESAG